MSLWRVYAHMHDMITMYVHADSADRALGCARERLCVDRLPSGFATVSQPTKMTNEDLACSARYEDRTHKEISDMARGRHLSADEQQYCLGRGYDSGVDIDSFEGLQWSHLVDDSVALCRTTALWGSGQNIQQISCPFCLHILKAEMRYPHLALQVEARWRGQRKVAEIVYKGDKVTLMVNGIDVRVGTTDDYEELFDLSVRINTSEGSRHNVPAAHVYSVPLDGDARRARYIEKRLILDYGDLDEARRATLKAEADAIAATMTDAEIQDAERYLMR